MVDESRSGEGAVAAERDLIARRLLDASVSMGGPENATIHWLLEEAMGRLALARRGAGAAPGTPPAAITAAERDAIVADLLRERGLSRLADAFLRGPATVTSPAASSRGGRRPAKRHPADQRDGAETMTTAEIPAGRGGQAADEQGGLGPLGYKIFLDRYALKDMTKRTITPGDTVVVVVDQKTGQREIGTVTARNDGTVAVELRDGGTVQQAIEHVDKPLETHPAQMVARVAAGIAGIEAPEKQAEWREKFNWLLTDWRFIPGGRILAAAGTEQQLTLFNCYVIPSPEDSRTGIVQTLSQMMEIMSRGGGVGINVSTLRPKHAYVKGVNGRSSGAVSWGALYSFVTGLIEQGGSRRGALMLILNDWHPDLPEFIRSKREMGKITNANISVGVSDAFMAAVEADAEWELVFPDTTDAEYGTLWNGDLTAWRAAGKAVVTHRTLKARELWDQIVESAWASAEPGVFFADRYNAMSNSWYYAPIACTNPCVTGDTLVYTAHGLQRVNDLVADGRPVDVVLSDGRRVRASAMFHTGRKPVYRLETVEGYSVRLTANHQVLTARGWVEAQQLRDGDRIKLLAAKGGFGTAGSEALGKLLGWLVGDGTFSGDRAVLSFFGDEKRELAPSFAAMMAGLVPSGMGYRKDYAITATNVTGRDEARVSSTRFMRIAAEHGLTAGEKHRVPEGVFTGCEEMQRGFLQALFTADGQVSGGPTKGTSVRLTSISPRLLVDVQRLLLNFGIASQIYRERRGEMLRQMPDGRGGSAMYLSKAQHDLVISKDNLYRFASEIGFLSTAKQSHLVDTLAGYGKRGPYREYFTARFVTLVPDGEEDVYDLIEPETHSFVANGMVVHNCGEQGLPPWGVCNLGAIHLAKFVTPAGEVRWEDLGRAVRYGVRFLDNVIDATPYFFAENEERQKSERRVGLGTMGLGEMLIRLGIRYGSAESERFIDKLYEFIASEAYLASAEYAAEKGAFPRFEVEKLLESGYMRGMPEPVRATVAEKGLRNVTLLTQAPTGTTGTMMDTSTGIEPFFSWTYLRKGRLGVHEETVKVALEWQEEHPGEELPEHFVTAMDLSPEEHVRVEAAIQRWVDSSISKTANLPAEYTVEQTRELYELMYKLGCKGGTVYRDSSRDEQVLMLKPATGAEAASRTMADEPVAAAAPVPVPVAVTVVPANVAAGGAEESGRPMPRRQSLPDERTSITHKFVVGEQEGYITVGLYEDGRPGEVFLRVNKQGSTVSGLMESLGLLTSIALQYGVPLEGLARKMKNSRFEPYGMTNNREIPTSTSLVDYLFRWLEKKFVLGEQLSLLTNGAASSGAATGGGAQLPMLPEPPTTQATATTLEKANVEHVPSGMGCPECGSMMHYAEGCLICRSCGYTKCG